MKFKHLIQDIGSKEIEISKLTEQASNLGAFISALYNEDYEMISRCVKDIIVEPYRSEIIPEFNNLKKIALEEVGPSFGDASSRTINVSLSKGPKIANDVKINLEKHLQKKNIKYKAMCQ